MTDPAQGGFTLLELLVAMAVAALAFVSAFGVLWNGGEWLSLAAGQQQAAALAQSILARLGQDIPLPDGRMEGNEGAYHWTVDVAPADITRPVMAGTWTARLVQVAIAWPSDHPRQSMRLTTIRLDPTRPAAEQVAN